MPASIVFMIIRVSQAAISGLASAGAGSNIGLAGLAWCGASRTWKQKTRVTGAVAILAKSPSPPNKAGGSREAAPVTPDFFPTDNLSEAVEFTGYPAAAKRARSPSASDEMRVLRPRTQAPPFSDGVAPAPAPVTCR
ncbi:hypothetical protein B0H14DRAFT_2641983 [Mycena olivaceomarginata]|nr:hypothetical protein B0H14DRAFT_2641983 [Mycena olivaceomarginata]